MVIFFLRFNLVHLTGVVCAREEAEVGRYIGEAVRKAVRSYFKQNDYLAVMCLVCIICNILLKKSALAPRHIGRVRRLSLE